jgi:predicted RNase H-like HicB family nuclease
MTFTVEIKPEDDGRWIAEVLELPGVLTYGQSSEEAQAKVQALALRVVADRLEHGEAGPDLLSISGSPGIPVVTGQSSLSHRAKLLEILG